MKRATDFSHAKMVLILEKIPMFRQFKPYEREKIVDHAHFYHATSADRVIEQGTLDTSFYVLMSGKTEVFIEGVEASVAQIEPGEFFGELSFLLNRPRSSTVIASKDCVLLRLDRQLLGKLNAEMREKIKDQIIVKLANLLELKNKKAR
ncbi:MAG: cyclic nucleotide-binding domain-containing protein [Saccharospirillaceae bacterium]|nr:cyclic nucleotide-binding domain-containing protein [Pseudomonadales bacterium]NRB79485.1 cyclic nucleotide-binding domain-containing protein [Saccharospirillaceae bacterium]